MLRSLKSSYSNLGKQGNVFQGDAAVLNDHVFRMQVPATIIVQKLESGDIDESLNPNIDLESLAETKKTAEIAMETAANGVKLAQSRIEGMTEEITRANNIRQEAQQRLIKLGVAVELANQAKQWSVEISDLPPEEVVARFEQTADSQGENVNAIREANQAMVEAREQLNVKQREFETLLNPLLRSTQQKHAAEQQAILKKLYSFTSLELPTETEDDASGKSVTAKSENVGDTTGDTEKYQNLLTTRTHIIVARAEKRDELVRYFDELKVRIEKYAEAINESHILSQKQYANAIELKTRIGRRQLSEEDIPYGITEALSQDNIQQLQTELADLSHQVDIIDRQRSLFAAPHETTQNLGALMDETIGTVGKRLDVIKDLDKLQTELSGASGTASAIEKTSLEQDAGRRLENESSRKEWLLGYVPSSRADHLTNVLKVYYQELIGLEKQQVNIIHQEELTNRIIELIEEEKASVNTLTPLLQKERDEMGVIEEDAWVTALAAFTPDQATEILAQHEAKTKRRLTPPPIVLDDEKIQVLEETAHEIFADHMQVLAASRWITLFQDRLSAKGLQGETAKYRDELSALKSRASAVQRRINRISGKSPETMATLDDADMPQTEAEKNLFLNGEIGRLRAERADIQSDSIVQLVARIVVIWVLAFIITLVFSRIINRMTRKHKDSESGSNAQTLLVLSFIKTMGKIVIWITAIILIFSSLGFNVGAVLAGLGIGGLAIAMAARETLSDLLGGIMIFIERPFVIGDVVKIGGGVTTRVVDMTWRSTLLRTPWNYTFSTPNSQVANSVISNFTKEGPTMDFVPVYLSPEYDPVMIQDLIEKAVLSVDITYGDEGGCSTGGIVLVETITLMRYWPWWYVNNYASRGKFRGAVWKAIWAELSAAGIKMEIKPIPNIDFSDTETDSTFPTTPKALTQNKSDNDGAKHLGQIDGEPEV
ncbi:MAG: mechanosensitive ion channel [Gammaproteobacteria bacterium]|nr:mechanosensitive ion channel [Gammaproteobacteria bacterium]